MILGIKGKMKGKQSQVVGGLLGHLVAATAQFSFFLAETSAAEKRVVASVHYVKVKCSNYTH